MNQIQALFGLDWVSVIIGVLIIMLGIKEIITLTQFFLKQFGVHTKIDDEKELIEQRLTKLEQHDEWQYEKINEISEGIKDIKETIKENKKSQDEVTVVTCRSNLYRLHLDFTEQGYVTREGLKTFIEMGKVYEKANGDDIYHSKLYPEVMDLPIKED